MERANHRGLNTGLSAQDLSCRRHDRLLFSDLSFQLTAGEVLEVCGPNGSGKTTLLRILCGLRQPDQGSIQWRGKSITEDPSTYRSDMLYLGHRQGLNGDLSAQENLRIEAKVRGLDEKQIPLALGKLGLSASLQELPCRQLSAGQRQRASLARLLMRNIPLWILDEPIASLDSTAQSQVLAMISEHVQQGGAVIFTTHQPMPIENVSVTQLTLGGAE